MTENQPNIKIAFLFPGQGSQYVGMGKDLYDQYSTVRELYDRAESILDIPIKTISFEGPEETLKQTEFTQPALFIHSMAVAELLKPSLEANAAAGHSLGEFSALTYAGAFSFEEGLQLVRERGKLMQNAGDKKPGSMAAVMGIDPETLLNLCIQASDKGVVQPANYNSPQQIVISGSKEGVAEALNLARDQGARRIIELPVSGAFHSPLMSDAVDEFGQVLKRIQIKETKLPVYANVTAEPVVQCDEISKLLQSQLTHPVRWVETIQNMIRDGVNHFIEVGPGEVLSGLVKRIDRNVSLKNYGTIEDIVSLDN
jgi:[acyl-carrier-protein] S-malonyltransferase